MQSLYATPPDTNYNTGVRHCLILAINCNSAFGLAFECFNKWNSTLIQVKYYKETWYTISDKKTNLNKFYSHTKKLHEAKERLEAAEKVASPEVKQLKEEFIKLEKEMEDLKKKEEELKLKDKVSFSS